MTFWAEVTDHEYVLVQLALQVGPLRAEELLDRVRAEYLGVAEKALLATTDGGELHDDAVIPAGEIRRILAELADLDRPWGSDGREVTEGGEPDAAVL